MVAYLNAHSYFSFLEGLASPVELVKAAAETGLPALALTDSHSLTGAVEFYSACQSAGIKPVFGLEVLVAPPVELVEQKPAGLVFLAQDSSGWTNLCKVASCVQPGEVIPFESLAALSDGLICLTGGKKGALFRLAAARERAQALLYLEQLKNIFRGGLYLELQFHDPDDPAICLTLAALAHKAGIPTIATHSIYYLDPNQAPLQRTLSAIRLNSPLHELPAGAVAPLNASFLPVVEFKDRFDAYPKALENTLEVAERCQGVPPVGSKHYPASPLAPDVDPEAEIRRKAFAGAARLYGSLTPEIQERLDHELSVIQNRGYTSIFLIMEEIIGFASRRGIPTASRGSASSSLVAHCLGITTPDPLAHNLYFERFLNPARTTPPDIDTDICSQRRDEVLKFVVERFGVDKVAMVSTISRFRERSALREVAKAYGLPAKEITQLIERIPWRWPGPRTSGKDAYRYARLKATFRDPLHADVFRDAAALIDLPDHLSVHPGGMVISPLPITDLVATQSPPKGIQITQFDLDLIEALGLVKLDLLGIRGLSVLGEVAAVLAKNNPDHPAPLEVLEGIPQEDNLTSETVRQARTIGCFQIESPGMRATLKEIKARSIDDILVALALFRPGPLSGGLKDAFVKRHLGLEEPVQLHPALTSLLADTYGVILYQEQVLRIAHQLAGLSLADSDLLRRAMSHFDPGKAMQTLKEKFITGAYQVSGVPVETGSRIWELMAAFAGYGFPKAHAASYAVVAWRAAWCKTHYPDIFISAVLAGGGGYYRQRVYLNQARRMGLKLQPPKVNDAKPSFSLSYAHGSPELFMGLSQVKELTDRTQNKILRERPFHSLVDFLARVDPRPLEADNLARCGALGDFGKIPSILAGLNAAGIAASSHCFRNQASTKRNGRWSNESRPKKQSWGSAWMLILSSW